MRATFASLTKFEKRLWLCSLAVVTVSFLLGGKQGIAALLASMIGLTSLIFLAKGNVLGHMLGVAFSLLYAAISYQQQYYGEMITYLGMTGPMAALSVISWLRHPYGEERAEVAVSRLKKGEPFFAVVLTALVTLVFYFILRYFHTAMLAVSTLSIATSFLASYLTFRRCAGYALAYAANDVVLIVLWLSAARQDISCLSMAACFFMFLFNDFYGYVSWSRMKKRQMCLE